MVRIFFNARRIEPQGLRVWLCVILLLALALSLDLFRSGDVNIEGFYKPGIIAYHSSNTVLRMEGGQVCLISPNHPVENWGRYRKDASGRWLWQVDGTDYLVLPTEGGLDCFVASNLSEHFFLPRVNGAAPLSQDGQPGPME